MKVQIHNPSKAYLFTGLVLFVIVDSALMVFVDNIAHWFH
jgi:hypothetical protein